MNTNGLIGMVMRMVLNKGINAGVRHASRKGKAEADMTPEEKAAARRTQQNAGRGRQGLNMLRRFGRF